MAALLLEQPAPRPCPGRKLAELRLRDPSLDRLRHELLNLAASGSSLEKAPVLNHFMRLGMADLLARLGAAPKPGAATPESVPEDETEARFLRAAADFRAMAEWEPERDARFQALCSRGQRGMPGARHGDCLRSPHE